MLVVIDLLEKEKWNKVVKSFGARDVYYSWGYCEGFRIHGDGEPLLFHYEDDNIRAINVVMKRDISYDDLFAGKVQRGYAYDLTTPYGYGGFIREGLINDESLEGLHKQYQKYCVENNIICEFVRFHPLLRNAEINDTIYNVQKLGRTVTVNLDSKEQIWNNFSSKNRNHVRKAIKVGVEIRHGMRSL